MLSNSSRSGRYRPIHAIPAPVAAGRVELGERRRRRPALAVAVDRAIDDHARQDTRGKRASADNMLLSGPFGLSRLVPPVLPPLVAGIAGCPGPGRQPVRESVTASGAEFSQPREPPHEQRLGHFRTSSIVIVRLRSVVARRGRFRRTLGRRLAVVEWDSSGVWGALPGWLARYGVVVCSRSQAASLCASLRSAA